MKKQRILIPGTLTVQRCIRIFVADTEAEARDQPFDTTENCSFDRPLRNAPLPDHDMVMRMIRRRFEMHRTSVSISLLDEFGPVVRSGILHGGVIYAYQFVETTTIEDDRSSFGEGHENTETSSTSKLLSKKYFIFGETVTSAKLDRLINWVRAQTQIANGLRDHAGFKMRGVSFYTALGAEKMEIGRHRHFIKMGPATFVPFDRKTMELRPID
ncbi:MAG: hypothetical protein KBC33_03045 [Candidatus Pacebacteria bacterium]|nr:hypothetical protein [Candidatus Paceibacterota bacterium]